MSRKEIEGWLAAYRNGWITYDREHVQQLQRMLRGDR